MISFIALVAIKILFTMPQVRRRANINQSGVRLREVEISFLEIGNSIGRNASTVLRVVK